MKKIFFSVAFFIALSLGNHALSESGKAPKLGVEGPILGDRVTVHRTDASATDLIEYTNDEGWAGFNCIPAGIYTVTSWRGRKTITVTIPSQAEPYTRYGSLLLVKVVGARAMRTGRVTLSATPTYATCTITYRIEGAFI